MNKSTLYSLGSGQEAGYLPAHLRPPSGGGEWRQRQTTSAPKTEDITGGLRTYGIIVDICDVLGSWQYI